VLDGLELSPPGFCRKLDIVSSSWKLAIVLVDERIRFIQAACTLLSTSGVAGYMVSIMLSIKICSIYLHLLN
jgi:hypothetical protein